jgi:uncharacterized membrane protein
VKRLKTSFFTNNTWVVFGLLLVVWASTRTLILVHKDIRSYDGSTATLGATGNLPVIYDLMNENSGNTNLQVAKWRDIIFNQEGKTIKDVYDGQLNHDIHPPLYFYLLHIWYKIFGLNPQWGVLLNILIEALILILVYSFLIKEGFSKYETALVLAWFIISVNATGALSVLRPYVLLQLFVVLFFKTAYCFFEKDKKTGWDSVKLGLIIGLGTVTHYQFLAIPVIVFAGAFIQAIRKRMPLNYLSSIWLPFVVALLVCEIVFPGMFKDFYYSSNGLEGRDFDIEPALIAQYFSHLILPYGVSNFMNIYLIGATAFIFYLIMLFAPLNRNISTGVLLFAKYLLLFYLLGVVFYLMGIYFPHTLKMHRYYYIYTVAIALLLIGFIRKVAWVRYLVLLLLIVQFVGVAGGINNYSKKHIDYPDNVIAIGLNRAEFSLLVSKLEASDRLAYFANLSIEEFEQLKLEKGVRLVFGKRIVKGEKSALLDFLEQGHEKVAKHSSVEITL